MQDREMWLLFAKAVSLLSCGKYHQGVKYGRSLDVQLVNYSVQLVSLLSACFITSNFAHFCHMSYAVTW